MNHETDHLLAEVMAEGAPAEFHEAMLRRTLRAARRRRHRRQAWRAAPVFIALALIAVFLHRMPIPRRAPEAVEIERPYQLVQTVPLSASELVTTRTATFQVLSTNPAVIDIVQTTATSGVYRLIGDDELLGIVEERPAMLVRMDSGSERLVFLNPDDAKGFPVNRPILSSAARHSGRMPPLGMSLRDTATEIVRRLQTAGFSAYWVGGCVRDYLLGREAHDFDIATSARPEQIEALFRRTIPVGRQFGVLIVREGGHEFQVATFRAEADYQDGRHPEQVVFADAQADANRRDFTVNGLFFDPVAKQLHDWVGGEADLRAKLLRTIGSPAERFAEDQLRLLRAVRFAAQLDLQIEAETFAALKLNASKILNVSAERIRDELLKVFRPPHAARGLDLLRDSGLLAQVLPEIAAMVGCEQSPNYHPEGTVYNHVRLMLEQLPPDAPASLPWMVLLHDVAKPVTATRDPETGLIHFYGHEKVGADMAEAILLRLKFPRKQIEEITAAVRHHMQFKDVKDMRKSTVRRMLLRDTFPLELELHRLDCTGSHRMLDHYEFMVEQARELERQPQIRPPLLSGDDLMALGVKSGPRLGELLAELREKQLLDELKTVDEAREWVKGRIKQK